MQHQVKLTITSLLSILFFTFHVSDDIVRGFEPGGFKHISTILILVVWLYGTLALSGRRSGYIIILVASLLSSLMPLAHMRGRGLAGGSIATSSGALFFVWTLVSIGVTAAVSVILSVRGLWSLPWRRTRKSTNN
ncbi:MAG TPA: hypothetical protein VF089_12700 [Candidatus Binatia bacterium]